MNTPYPYKVSCQPVLFPIYADMRIFCCLLVRVYKKEYICKKSSPNMNIKYIRFLTSFEFNIKHIHSSQPDRIQISNIFILSNLAEYEYQIYLKPRNWVFLLRGVKKMLQSRDSAGAVCNSIMGIFFWWIWFFRGGVYLVLRAIIHTYVKLNNSRLCI